MKDRYIIAVLAVFLQIAVLVGCSGRESNSIEIASVNGEKILASDFDLAKAQYESKNMLDAELLDGLIKERIVLQYGEKIEDIITEEDVEKKLQALKAEQNGNIFYQKAMKEYGSEEAIKIALKNRLIYNFVKDDLMNQFLSVLRIDEDKLYFRAEEFAEQYDIDRLDNKEREDYLETVFMQYRDSLTNELFDLYFQVWLNEQFKIGRAHV